MDPDAGLAALLDACRDGDREAAWQHMEDLYDWLAKGGLMPRDPREQTEESNASRFGSNDGLALALRAAYALIQEIYHHQTTDDERATIEATVVAEGLKGAHI